MDYRPWLVLVSALIWPRWRARRGHGVARSILGLLILLAGCATPRVRALAEWEPAEGVLVAYPFHLPPQLLRELAREVHLYVLVANQAPASGPAHASAAAAALAQAGVAADRFTLVPTTVKTEWTRDYGPFTVARADGQQLLVDADYIETPIFAADAPPVRRGQQLLYPRRSPGDDRTPVDLAVWLGLPRAELPAFVTGGNFLVDGHGTAFATTALLDENRTRMDDGELRLLLRQHLGITRLVVLDNVEELGIQHIDCWLKLLDAQTLLVKRAPTGHFEHARIERNVVRLRQVAGPDGTPYRIVRIECPPFRRVQRKDLGKETEDLAAYTNSILLGRRVFVPQFGIPADEAALTTYRAALPGHEVVGVPYPEWKGFDALHCRTRAVFRRPRARA